MANYANLLATIAANIYTNNNNEVTAAMVKSAVDQMVASLGAGYQFMGVATPATNPSNLDSKQFYLASQPGTYTNFSGAVVNDGEVAILKYDTAWSKVVTGAATEKEMRTIQDINELLSSATLFKDGYTLNPDGTYYTSPYTTNYGCYKVDLTGVDYDVIRALVYSSGYGYSICGLFDADDNFITNLKTAVMEEAGTVVEVSFVNQPAVAYAIFTSLKAEWSARSSILAIKYNEIKQFIEAQIGNLSDEIKETIQEVFPNLESAGFLFKDGYTLNPDGTYTSNQYTTIYGCYKLDISNIDADLFMTDIYSSGSGFAMVGVFDADDNFLESIYTAKATEQGTIKRLTFARNPGWAYLIITAEKAKWGKTRITGVQYTAINTYLYSLVAEEQQVFYVGSTRAGDNCFTTLKAVTEYISQNGIRNATVYVDGEEYDLISEYGQAYLDAYTVGDRDELPFLHFKNNTHYIFMQGAKIKCCYDGTNPVVSTECSAINISGSCIIENADIEAENMRYCVHEDLPTGTSDRPISYTAIYKNCRMNHKGNPVSGYSAPICIGAGCFRQSLSIVEGGVFIVSSNSLDCIGWHNFDKASFGDYVSRVIVKNAWMNTGMRLGVFGDSLAVVEVSGCYMPTGFRNSAGYEAYFDLKEWNNTNS